MPELLRKQYLVSGANVRKLNKISKAKSCSAAEVVRQAIDSYDPDNDEAELDQLVALMSESINEATSAVRSARKLIRKTKKDLDKK